MSGIQIPRINTQDPAAHDESSEDHFSSASEGPSDSHSPVPITRVERVDDSAAYGEVPGTPAYNMRTTDAVPDEIEIVPDGQRSRSGTRSRAMSQLSLGSGSRPQTPGGTRVPRTVVEKVDDKPSHGEVEGTPAKEMRMADAMPDEIRKAPEKTRANLEGRSGSGGTGGFQVEGAGVMSDEDQQVWFRSMWEGKPQPATPPQASRGEELDDDGIDDDEVDFGDDFNEFAEGDGDDDFGDFDEAGQPPMEDNRHTTLQNPPPDVLAGLPRLDLSSCTDTDELQEAITPYINAIIPNSKPAFTKSQLQPLDPSISSTFLSDRSLSLWQQLVSPPPTQPPNWTRSRIRRLFLVSLGVPVDLDEILPPSKQKRLVLPNVNFERTSPRPSAAIERLRETGANDSTTSIDSKGQPKPSKSRRAVPKGPPPPPDFDTNAATLLCRTTVEAMSVYNDVELKDHVMTLQLLNEKASKVLEYWLQRKDEGMREKEALEGVIENLVGFVKGRRGK